MQESSGGEAPNDDVGNHQLWLVPIRTARATLAVLRISVHLQPPHTYDDSQSTYDDLNRGSGPIPHSSTATNNATTTTTTDTWHPTTPASHTLTARGPSPSPSLSPSWDIALSDVVNFAEQMVPLIVAGDKQHVNNDRHHRNSPNLPPIQTLDNRMIPLDL